MTNIAGHSSNDRILMRRELSFVSGKTSIRLGLL